MKASSGITFPFKFFCPSVYAQGDKMDVVVLKIGGKAQREEKDVDGIVDQVINFLYEGYDVMGMASAKGDTTDRLLYQAKEKGIFDGRELARFLIDNGEIPSNEQLTEKLVKRGVNVKLVTPYDHEFFLYADGFEGESDFRNMEFSHDPDGFLNCSVNIGVSYNRVDSFISDLAKNDVVIMTPWAVKRGWNGKEYEIGVIRGRGGSDSSLVAVQRILHSRGFKVRDDVGIKVTDVVCIYDSSGKGIGRIRASDLIGMQKRIGTFPVQQYALEELAKYPVNCPVGIGVAPYSDMKKIGTYIFR